MTSLQQLKRFEARISLFKSLDCPLALAAAGRNQRFTRYPPVINHNQCWCNWNVHIDSLILTLVKYFGIFNQLKDYASNQLARKLYNAFVYSSISYSIEVYGSCSDTPLERLQVIPNKLLKLLLRLDPYTSNNLLHSELNILKVKYLYNASLLLFMHAYLQGDCPAAVKNYFVRRNSAYNTRQT